MTIEAREPGERPPVPARAIELAARHLGGAVESVSVAKLAGDASSRAYFRANLERNTGGPSVIIAVYPAGFDIGESAAARLARSEAADPGLRLTFANDPCAHVEITTLFRDAGLPVPRIIDVAGGEGVMLIEEVGDCKLQDWLGGSNAEQRLRAYRHAVDLIVAIQELTPVVVDSASICSRLAFDEAKLKWELDFFFKNYFERHLRLKLSAERSGSIDSEFVELCRDLSGLPRVLVHRDYHARNLMMRDGEMFIIDHQDARMGPESYDLVSLISDPYAGVDAGLGAALVEYFVESKSRSRLKLSSEDQFRAGLELTTIQRMLKAVGTYASQAVKDNPVYLPYITPGMRSALGAIQRSGRFHALRDLLEETCCSP